MIIPRDADGAGDVVISGRELHAGAGGLLTDRRAVELLPRGLVCGIGEAALGLQVGVALRIDGEPDVPDWRPSPMQGREWMPRLIRAAGGCMFTTSAPPG